MCDMSRQFPFPIAPVLEFSPGHTNVVALPSLLDLPNRLLTRSGRSALLLALQLSGVTAGDRVWVPTYYCPTIISPIESLGALPVFYPLTATGAPDIDYLSATAVKAPRAMVAVHYFGLPRTLSNVLDYCHANEVKLIEDCAHCFYGAADGTAIGTTGDYAIGSLTKFFPVIEGGVVASSQQAINLAMQEGTSLGRELRSLWDMVDMSARSGRLGLLGMATRTVSALRRSVSAATTLTSAGPPDYAPELVRSQALADPLLRVGRLRQCEEFVVMHTDAANAVASRRRNFSELARKMAELPGVHPLVIDCGEQSAPYVMPLFVAEPVIAYQRMRARGLPVFRWDQLWPGTPILDSDPGPVWSKHIIQIACHQSLRPDDISRMIAELRHCLAG
jgi:hypothetical protein